jgi:F0F1-type ATP synthase beta subunit
MDFNKDKYIIVEIIPTRSNSKDGFIAQISALKLEGLKLLDRFDYRVKDELIDNVYYWIKANDKMSASNQSSFTSNSGWRFIPLIENNNSKIKEFSAIVNVSNASINSVCQFLVMDGFDDNSGRTYYKNGNNKT